MCNWKKKLSEDDHPTMLGSACVSWCVSKMLAVRGGADGEVVAVAGPREEGLRWERRGPWMWIGIIGGQGCKLVLGLRFK